MVKVLTLILLAGVALAQVAGPDEMIKGMNFIRFSSGYPYNSPSAESSLIKLKNLTLSNWLVIVPVWWMSDTGSQEILWIQDSSPGDSEIVWIINRAHSLGLKVFLRPEVHCLSGVWQGYHNPHDTNWFFYYRLFISNYARIAQRTGCEMFSVGAELDRSADEPWEIIEWQKTIRMVRTILLPGLLACPLAYAADWRTFASIPFWDSLDYIGINAYFPLRNDTQPYPPPPPSVDYLSHCWNIHLARIKILADSLTKPVIFTEVGYRSIIGSTKHPWDDTLPGAYNEIEQRNGYIACFHSILGKPWFAGWFWFNWTTDTLQAGIGDLSYTPKNKLAQEVLRRFNSSICSHKGFCLPATYDSIYFWPRTYQALDSLVAHNANWVAVNARWIMADTGVGYDTIRPISGHSPDSLSIRAVIDSAHQRGLSVALSCYLAVTKGAWCGWHNPGHNTNWFRDESVYVCHCARIAEQESVEMLTIGLELNRTMDSSYEANLWRRMIIPAVREIYSGPLCYGASCDPFVHQDFWAGIDLCGVHPYVQMFHTGLGLKGYPDDTMVSQRPTVQDLWKGDSPPYNLWAWEWKYIPILRDSWYRVIEKPILFTEIGYRSLDSTALHPAWDHWYGWTRVPAHGDTVDTVTLKNLHSLCFPVDTLVGYIVGDSGTILKTVNSGKNFVVCPSGTSSSLYAVDFPSRDTGYAVGEGGIILLTTNGFDSYENIAIDGMNISYYSVCFPDNASTGYIVGDGGVILLTTNGGQNWQRQFCTLPSGETLRLRLRSVCFVPDIQVTTSVGYIVGDSGTILKTTNGGSSWQKLPSPVDVNLKNLDFISPNLGFVVGEKSTLLKTTDGGNSWQIYSFRTQEWDFNAVNVPDYDSARFIVGTKGLILRAGDAWDFDGSCQFSNTRQNLNDVQFFLDGRTGYYELIGFAVGDSGTILRAFSGGRMRVDFNEQANCYEAAFRAFWRDRQNPKPLPWFYGFHFWKWVTDPEPMDIEHEVQIDDYTPQQKRAAEIVREWFRAKK
jgi:photosystem II stability/assembly factor-like uncharacterized protein